MDIIQGFYETFNDLLKEKDKILKEIGKELHTSPYSILRWKNHPVDLKLKSLIKLADYFNCSLEYLCGKSKTHLDYTPKDCPVFADWIAIVLKIYKSSSYKLFKHTTIKPAQYHRWRKGTEPLLSSLETVAEYLDVTLDCLIGRDR